MCARRHADPLIDNSMSLAPTPATEPSALCTTTGKLTQDTAPHRTRKTVFCPLPRYLCNNLKA